MAQTGKDGKRSSSAGRKAKYKSYRDRATCLTCGITFKSPRKRARHVKELHKWRPLPGDMSWYKPRKKKNENKAV